MITTTKGDMDESLLRKVDGGMEDDNEQTTWVEYYLGEELVHRSVHITLKQSPAICGVAGDFNG
jgi:hypothetical protein